MANPPLPIIASNTEETAFAVLEGNVILEKVNVAITDMSKKMTTSIGHLTSAFISFTKDLKEQQAAMLAGASLSADNSKDTVGPSNKKTTDATKNVTEPAMSSVWETIKSLGFWAGTLAGALTVGAGLVLAQIRNIKTYMTLIGDTINGIKTTLAALSPEFLKNSIGVFKNNMLLSFGQFTESVAEIFAPLKTKFANISTFVEEILTSLKTSISTGIGKIQALFTFGEESNIAKVMGSVRTAIGNFLQPFKTAITTLTDLVAAEGPAGKIATFASDIFGKIGSFGKIFGGLAELLGKIFAPILILTTAFDTIKGAIDGYAEGGIIGGLKGAIDALFDSLIGAPLKMLTDAVAWVLGKLGFDEASEALSAFDPSAIWSKITSAIFDGVGSAIDWVKSFFVWSTSDTSTTEEPGFISKLVSDAWESVKQWFVNAISGIADSMPSMDDITSSLIASLPSWMVPDSYKTPDMIATEIKTKIADEQGRIDRSKAGSNEYYGYESTGQASSAKIIKELEAQLAEVNATKTRGGNNNVLSVNGGSSSVTNNQAGSTVVMGVPNPVGGLSPDRYSFRGR